MSTAVRRSAAVCLLHALLIPRSITAMSATAYADVRLDRRAVDRWIGDYVQSGGLAGASVAVIKNGDVVYRTDPGQEAEGIIAADRSMAIGSVSKMITGFAVLQLVDAGRIDLDQPVRRQLPEFTVDDPRGTLITVRQLLSHRSGLPNPTLIAPAASPQERVGQLRNVHLDSHPGSRYVYSNLNYHVAVRLVEVSSGQDCLGVRGVVRSRIWVARRDPWPAWHFGLRLLPQLLMPAVAVGAFVVLPPLSGPRASAVDAFGLWPAAMVLRR